MRMYVAGEWWGAPVEDEVTSPFSGEIVDTVPRATDEDVERALVAAARGAQVMRRLPACDRATILNRAADLLENAAEQLARTISAEEGKPLAGAMPYGGPRGAASARRVGATR